MVFEVRARTWTAKPSSQRRIEADTAAMRADQDRLERQLRTDKHLLREEQEVAWRARNTAARYGSLVNSAAHPMYGGYGYPIAGVPRTRAISQYGYPGLVTPGMHRHPLDARMLQDIRHHRNLAALTQQERMLHQERELSRLQQMEEMRLRNGAVNSYNLSPRYYDLPEPGMRTPMVAPLTPHHHHHHRRASFGTPYSSDLLSPYERLAALEPAPYHTPRVTPYMDTHTPYGRRLGTPYMDTIDPVLF